MHFLVGYEILHNLYKCGFENFFKMSFLLQPHGVTHEFKGFK